LTYSEIQQIATCYSQSRQIKGTSKRQKSATLDHGPECSSPTGKNYFKTFMKYMKYLLSSDIGPDNTHSLDWKYEKITFEMWGS
jgi:hypothetical protein